ncbi:hypothetical protein M885DRAFT_39067 [Pelagophyceae sp. CCMP2097]|nr:hypothetical protein M885DRAFT_39067 [Pelagophyceae sp. CCMP2097]
METTGRGSKTLRDICGELGITLPSAAAALPAPTALALVLTASEPPQRQSEPARRAGPASKTPRVSADSTAVPLVDLRKRTASALAPVLTASGPPQRESEPARHVGPALKKPWRVSTPTAAPLADLKKRCHREGRQRQAHVAERIHGALVETR